MLCECIVREERDHLCAGIGELRKVRTPDRRARHDYADGGIGERTGKGAVLEAGKVHVECSDTRACRGTHVIRESHPRYRMQRIPARDRNKIGVVTVGIELHGIGPGVAGGGDEGARDPLGRGFGGPRTARTGCGKHRGRAPGCDPH